MTLHCLYILLINILLINILFIFIRLINLHLLLEQFPTERARKREHRWTNFRGNCEGMRRILYSSVTKWKCNSCSFCYENYAVMSVFQTYHLHIFDYIINIYNSTFALMINYLFSALAMENVVANISTVAMKVNRIFSYFSVSYICMEWLQSLQCTSILNREYDLQSGQ